MKKEYIIPQCHASLLRGQHLMLGVSAKSDTYDDGNSDRSKGFQSTGDFWSDVPGDPSAGSDEKSFWK